MTHPLTSWLEDRQKTHRDFCRETGVSEATLFRLINGKSDLTTGLIRTVSKGTGGAVSEIDLYAAWLKAFLARSEKADEIGEAASS